MGEVACTWCYRGMDEKPAFDCKNPMHSGPTGCFHDLAVCDGLVECLHCGQKWLPLDGLEETIARAAADAKECGIDYTHPACRWQCGFYYPAVAQHPVAHHLAHHIARALGADGEGTT